VPIASRIYGGHEKIRLDVAIIDHDEKTILERLADMTAPDRHALLAQPREIRNLLYSVRRENRVRAVFLLDPTIPELFALPLDTAMPDLLGYFRSHPAEEKVAFEQPKLLAGARRLFGGIDPFIVFPALRDAATLAKALDQTPDLLHWIFEDTEPSLALTRLSREPVRKIAGELMEMRSTVYAGLPAYQHLTEDGRRGFDKLDKHITDRTSKDESGGTERTWSTTSPPTNARRRSRRRASGSSGTRSSSSPTWSPRTRQG
jgi:hypothetical protein